MLTLFVSNIISKLVGLFSPKMPPTGLLLDSPEIVEALPKHELFFGSPTGPGVDWKSFCPSFRYQGASFWCTAFAATAVASILENKERGGKTVFSAIELFYRSGGSMWGNYILPTVRAMQQGLVLESAIPTPIPDHWGQYAWSEYGKQAHATPDELKFGKQFAIKSFASVRTDKNSLRVALTVSPLLITIPIGRGYYQMPTRPPYSNDQLHALVLLGFDDKGNYVTFDSEEDHSGFDGFHTFAPDYPIISAMSFVDLPDNWQQVQNDSNQTSFGNALNHYGLVRDLKTEEARAVELSNASKANPAVSAIIGRDFTVYVNAISYGRYSVQDVLNSCFSVHRGGSQLFDFNHIHP